MLAEGLNGLLGHSALMVGLAATVFGALALAMSIVTRNPNLRRLVQAYGWTSLVAAVAAVVVMERALITRDWSVAYVQKVGSPNTPALFNFTALWARWRAASCCGCCCWRCTRPSSCAATGRG